MLTEPQPHELYPPAHDPVRCRWCRTPIALTAIGWTHLDEYRALSSWLCPVPYLHLAEPQAQQPVTASEPTAQHRAARTAEAHPSPRRRPTPIPPRKESPEAPAEWPPPVGESAWWEQH
jgi:hypothetical protein